jgi:hypothetical protein
MSDASKVPDDVRRLAEQAGLTRALELFPNEVKAAAERGLRPLGEHSKGVSTSSAPASVFDPARFERDE